MPENKIDLSTFLSDDDDELTLDDIEGAHEKLPAEEPEEIEEELEETEEAQEEEEEKSEEEPEEAEEEESEETKEIKEEKIELPAEVREVLKQIKNEKIVSKGLEVPVKNLQPKEIVALLNKGLRFYQAMSENAKIKSELIQQTQQLQEALARVEEYKNQLARQLEEARSKTTATMPKELEITEFDDPETRALKKAAQEQWKANQELAQKVAIFEQQLQSSQVQERQKQVIKEIERLLPEYPLASPEEVLAIYALTNGKFSIEQIMLESHKQKANPEYVKKILQVSPEVKKALYDEITKEYLAKSKAAGQKRVGLKTAGISPAPGLAKKKVKITADNVDEILHKLLRKIPTT
jgi:hypothetical protein